MCQRLHDREHRDLEARSGEGEGGLEGDAVAVALVHPERGDAPWRGVLAVAGIGLGVARGNAPDDLGVRVRDVVEGRTDRVGTRYVEDDGSAPGRHASMAAEAAAGDGDGD